MKCKHYVRFLCIVILVTFSLRAPCPLHLFVSKPSKGTEQRPSATQHAPRTCGNWSPWSCHSIARKVIYRAHMEVPGQKQEAGTNPNYQNDALSPQIPACSRIKLRRNKNLLYLLFVFFIFLCLYVSLCLESKPKADSCPPSHSCFSACCSQPPAQHSYAGASVPK